MATGMAITTHGVRVAGRPGPAAHLRRGGCRPRAGRHRPRRLVSRCSTTTSAILDRRRQPASSTSSAIASGPRRRPSRAWSSSSSSCSNAAMRTQLLLSQDVCHDASSRRTAASATHTSSSISCRRLRTAAVGEGEIATMTIDNPRRHPDDRVAGGPWRPRATRSPTCGGSPSCSRPPASRRYRVRAFRTAAASVAALEAGELAARAGAGTLRDLPGIGEVTERTILESLRGEEPVYLRRAGGDRRPAGRPSTAQRSCDGACAATATSTPTGRTAARRSARWPRRRASSATRTSSSPTTRRA